MASRSESRGQRERELESNNVLQQYRHALSCVVSHFFFPLFLFLAAILMPDTCSKQCHDAVTRALQAVVRRIEVERADESNEASLRLLPARRESEADTASASHLASRQQMEGKKEAPPCSS